jgi:hypothetical protein
MSRIFVRERTRIGKGDKKPRFALVAAEGVDLDIFTMHVRKSELDALAAAIGAEVVFLPRGEKMVEPEAAVEPTAEPAAELVKKESKPKKKKKK